MKRVVTAMQWSVRLECNKKKPAIYFIELFPSRFTDYLPIEFFFFFQRILKELSLASSPPYFCFYERDSHSLSILISVSMIFPKGTACIKSNMIKYFVINCRGYDYQVYVNVKSFQLHYLADRDCSSIDRAILWSRVDFALMLSFISLFFFSWNHGLGIHQKD